MPTEIHQRGTAKVTIELQRSSKDGWTPETIAGATITLETPLRAPELPDSHADYRRLLADAVDKALDQATENLDRQVRLVKEDKRREEAEQEEPPV